ncbi:MAG: hypothetical protein EX285_04990 [Thaumarchaeota archaeon]|nr:hypothetical protein [Nitrososphaerota archaeon]
MNISTVASFEHYGVAPFEVEALFSILNGVFTVQEKEVKPNYENNHACMIDIYFPLEFNYNFFEMFGHKRWNKITFLIKEMRRRTGKKGVMLIMNFTGRPTLSFTVAMHDKNLFAFALEKMEILNELILSQTYSRKLPIDVESVHYTFNSSNSKWNPDTAWRNGTIFKCDEGEWIISNQL